MMTGKRKSSSDTAVDVAACGRNDAYEHLAALNGRPCEEHATVQQAAAADARAIGKSKQRITLEL